MRLLYPYAEEFSGERALEIHALNRAHSLAQAGLQVTFLLAQSPRFTSPAALLQHFGLQPSPNLSIQFLPQKLDVGPLHLASAKFFYRALDRFLHSQPPFHLAYLVHLEAAEHLLSVHSSIPVVFEAHEISADAFPEDSPGQARLQELEQNVYSRVRAIVSTSHFLLSALEDRYPIPAKTNVIPNGVHQSFFSVPLDQAEPRRLIYLGNLHPSAGIQIAISALASLPDFTLDIFGGAQDQIASWKTSAPPNVHFHNYLSQDRLLSALAKASVALVPNILEPKNARFSFPLKLLEYAAAGRIVVTSDLPVLRELRPGPWASVVPPSHPAALAQATQAMDQARHSSLQLAARQWARAFAWERTAEILKCFLHDLST